MTNVRNTKSPHWRRWLGKENRCVVPFTSFAENDQRPGRNQEIVWFALDESRPIAFFAGIWTTWTSVRKLKDGETTDDLYGFLTTEPNEVVGPVHPKAMPVILRTEDEIDAWLTLPASEALELTMRSKSLQRARARTTGATPDRSAKGSPFDFGHLVVLMAARFRAVRDD